MTDFEENWKNSEVISIFANNYVLSEDVVEPTPTNEYITEVRTEADPSVGMISHMRAEAALETFVIINDLKKLALEAIDNKNYKAALLIESAIEDLENRVDD